jgi:hypothetical protein
VYPVWQQSSWSQQWEAERGPVRFQVTASITGGFPGFTQSGIALEGAQIRLSDTYVLVDEGKARGFGLPIQWLDGAAMIAQPEREAPALRIFYRDGAAARHFTVRFRGGLRSLRRSHDADRMRRLLLELGLPDRPEDREPSAPDVRLSWEDARRFEQENVIWRGIATAPTLLGEDTAPADVWLTTRSIIWGACDGDGVNRLPLEVLSDVVTGQADDRRATPAVYLAFLDIAGGHVRFDLPFVFDQYSAERNLRERGAFLVGLRSRGVALGLSAPLVQPWRLNVPRVGGFADWSNSTPIAESEDETGGIPAIAHRCLDLVGGLARQMPTPVHLARIGPHRFPIGADGQHEDAAEPEPRLALIVEDGVDTIPPPTVSDVMLAEFSAPAHADADEGQPVLSTDIALASDWYEPSDDAAPEGMPELEEPPALEPTRAEMDIRGIGDPPLLDRVRAYEAANLALLSESLIAIRDRAAGLPNRPLGGDVPSQSMAQAAYAELSDLAASGEMSPQEAELRRVRLAAISEAARRLRSLVELRDAGHLTDADLSVKRAEISDELSSLILAGSDLERRR